MTPATGRAPAANTPTSAETACALRRRFPGALIWQGNATGHWWAYLPAGPRGRLLEATYPAEMAYRLAGVWRAHQGPPSGPGGMPSRATALARLASGLTGGGR